MMPMAAHNKNKLITNIEINHGTFNLKVLKYLMDWLTSRIFSNVASAFVTYIDIAIVLRKIIAYNKYFQDLKRDAVALISTYHN